MSGLPAEAVEAIVSLVEDAIVAGVHALDPEERKKTIREAVQREASRWAAIDPGLTSARADEITARHHVHGRAVELANKARGAAMLIAEESGRAAVLALADHVDP